MNKVCLIGRCTINPEIKQSSGGKSYTKFNIAINRTNGKREHNENRQTADFISCLAWEHNAEFLTRYLKKGDRVGIEGKIQTGTYNDSKGSKVYTTVVLVENITLLGTKKEAKKENESWCDLPF